MAKFKHIDIERLQRLDDSINMLDNITLDINGEILDELKVSIYSLHGETEYDDNLSKLLTELAKINERRVEIKKILNSYKKE